MSAGTAWSIKLPGASRTLRFEPADPDRHTVLLHDWMHRPHVAPWWGPDRTVAETRAYIERQRDTTHLTPWVVSAGALAFGYVETYRAADDPLAVAYPLDPGDRGWHVFVGPTEVLGKGLPRLMGRAVLARLLTEPGEPGAPVDGQHSTGQHSSGPVHRVVCEPDERNDRMIAFCHRLGYETLAHLDLGHKRAALLACTRPAFAARWPGDLVAGAASYGPHPTSRRGEGGPTPQGSAPGPEAGAPTPEAGATTP